jgi:serine/threonine protein phosphatase PrpC
MKGYRSFAVTVQGGSHIKSGTVCQDASSFYDDDSVSIAVVADGHGDSSCFRSDKGAKFAVVCATEGIKQFAKEHEALFKQGIIKKPGFFQKQPPSHRELEKSIREKLIKQTVASWNSVVMDHYQKNPFKEQEMEKVSEKYRKRYEEGENISKAYGTSLIAAAITPWYWFGFHIGDGRFSVLYKDSEGDQPVPWDPKCYLNVTTSICDDDILDRGEEGVRAFLSLHSDKAPPVALFLCSDGVDDNYPVEGNEEHLYRLYRNITVTFADDGYESTCDQIKELATGYATKGKGDDTSLAGIVNIDKLKEAAPQWKEKMAADEAERKGVKAEAEEKTGGGEDIENYGEFSSNAGQSEGDETKSRDELVQDAKRAINEAAKKIDMLA